MIIITAAMGGYGRLVVEALLRRGAPGAVRNPQQAADLAARGVRIRIAHFDRQDTLPVDFVGADKLLLIPPASSTPLTDAAATMLKKNGLP